MDRRQGKWRPHGCRHAGSECELHLILDDGGAGCSGAIADAYVYHGCGGLVEEDFRVPHDSGDICDEIATTTRLDAARRSV